jgi:hypothetical protein
MKEHETDLIIEMARRFITEAIELEPEFERAFFRFRAEERMYESCASYTTPVKAYIFDAFTLEEFFDDMNELGLSLLTEMKKIPGLLLLTIDKNFNYEIQFEYNDMGKWRISLADGGTGIPAAD